MRSIDLATGQKKGLRAKTLRRSALAVAIGVVMASTAIAQSSEGAIYGVGKAGTAVTVTNVETGQSRQVQTDSSGNFSVVRLAPGRYTVTSGGAKQDVTVSIGSNTSVDLNASQQLQAVTVTGSRARSVIDVRSVESNTVFTAEQIQELPVARNVNSVALLAPGVVKGDPDLGAGNLPSFGGASIAENGYYINGFDVTNIRNFLSYADLPFDAIGEQQIKTGGYGAEFGRSLGGVISLSTKRGTNEWKGGVSAYWAPASLRSEGQNVADKDPNRPANSYFLFSKDNTRSSFSTNFYAGGPLVKDKLFVFGLIERPDVKASSFGENASIQTSSSKPNGMLKIDFTPNDNHRFELTSINNKSSVNIHDYINAQRYSTTHDGAASESNQTSGGTVNIAKYTGYLTDNLTISALAGRVYEQLPRTTGARAEGLDCPVVLEGFTFTPVGCWSLIWPGSQVRDPQAPLTDHDIRQAARFDVDYKVGNHSVRLGLDNQTFTSSEAGGAYYNGAYYLYRPSVGETISGEATVAGTPLVRIRRYLTTGGEYVVKNTAKYIEDSWRVNKNVMLYGGLRWESFDNRNSEGKSFVKAENLLAPRAGASWDVNGDSSLKVFATAGRYYIPVASNTNVRATRGEEYNQLWYYYTSRDPRTLVPSGLTLIGNQLVDPASIPDPATIADLNLKPMSQDEFVLGFQKAISKGLTYGVKFSRRQLNNGMDDWCDPRAAGTWMNANGYPNFDWHSMAGCMMINPGKDVTLMMDAQDDGNLVPITIPASAIGLGAYTRVYKGLELTFNRAFDGKWGLSGSYTLSSSKGTGEGYVNSTINQDDAGVSQDYDFGVFDDGADGYLPNDRRHQIKVFGTVGLTENVRLGLNWNAQSGRPKSRIGFVPSDTPGGATAYNSASTYYYLDPQTLETVLGSRGNAGRTPWTNTFDVQVAYTKKMGGNQKLTLQVDVFNLFNAQKPTELYEINDYSRATTTVGAGAGNLLNYNYDSPTSFQAPRSVLFTARYEF